MLRAAAVAALALATLLAGCSGGDTGSDVVDDADGFEDLGVEATSTTGVILGVVVDEAIRPIVDAKVDLQKPDGSTDTQQTDAEGRFAYGDLLPGSYFLRVSHLLYTETQSTAEVVAGVEDPPVLRVQLTRLFSQDPYSELRKFDGFLACSYSFPVGSTCVNDYTRLNCIASPPAPCACPGGCLKEYNVSRTGGNIREYVSTVGPGWQQIVFETIWEPSLDGTSPELTISVSYFERISTSHYFGGTSGPSTMRLEIELGEDAEGQNAANGEPDGIGPEGRDDLFVFFNNGGGAGSVTVNQPFTLFHANFYYGMVPDGWSYVNGDPMPF